MNPPPTPKTRFWNSKWTTQKSDKPRSAVHAFVQTSQRRILQRMRTNDVLPSLASHTLCWTACIKCWNRGHLQMWQQFQNRVLLRFSIFALFKSAKSQNLVKQRTNIQFEYIPVYIVRNRGLLTHRSQLSHNSKSKRTCVIYPESVS